MDVWKREAARLLTSIGIFLSDEKKKGHSVIAACADNPPLFAPFSGARPKLLQRIEKRRDVFIWRNRRKNLENYFFFYLLSGKNANIIGTSLT